MRFRGLNTERHDVGPGREGMRREAVVQTFFARELSSGARGDARPFWALLAYAHRGPDFDYSREYADDNSTPFAR
jgi:hypothetical protein